METGNLYFLLQRINLPYHCLYNPDTIEELFGFLITEQAIVEGYINASLAPWELPLL